MKKTKYLVNLQNARIQAEVFEAIKAFMINGFKESECKPELMFVKEA
jgi:hypothetical protein